MPAELAIVILAAGKGTRLKSERPKVLHQAGGLPLVSHVLRAARPVVGRGRKPSGGRVDIWVVVGHRAEAVRGVVEAFGAQTVLQRPQLGTGHAVAQAAGALPARIKQLLVLPGDAPLMREGTLRGLLAQHGNAGCAATLLTAELENPHSYGRIIRGEGGMVDAIVEQGALRPEQLGLREVNAGVYCFERSKLVPLLSRLGRANVHGEYYLTDVVSLLRAQGERVTAFRTDDPEEILGINTPAELARVDAALRRRKAQALMASGVTLYQPETLVIDPDVAIGTDTVVEPGAQLCGSTRIGRHCRIGAFSVLENAVLADDVVVRPHCLVLNSRVASGVRIGPFAHLRDGADIRRDARIGNYVEVKKSVVGEGSKAQHLTYLGDASVGRGTNIGAGTITCNYDGVNKNRTAIGDQTFIGSGTMLVAPVKVGTGAYVAAGSTITENVSRDALAIGRSRQVNKPGWARTRRQKLAAAKAHKDEPAVAVRVGSSAKSKAQRQRPTRRKQRRRKVSGKPRRKSPSR